LRRNPDDITRDKSASPQDRGSPDDTQFENRQKNNM
jgi:hypothetical protein